MSLKKITNIPKNFYFNLPISFKVTTWYSFFIFLLFSLLITGSFISSEILFKDTSKKELIESVLEISIKPEEFKFYDDGIFFLQYNKHGQLLSGTTPPNFNVDTKLNSDIKNFKSYNEEFFYFDAPLNKDENIWIRGVMPVSKTYKNLKLILYSIIFFSPLIFIFIVYGGYKIIKNSFKPVEKIANTALEIKESRNFSKRIPTGASKDEIYKMTTSFNIILDNLENSYVREKQFSSNVAHELKTPLTVILAESEYSLNYANTNEEYTSSLKTIKKQTEKMSSLIQQLMNLAKLDQIEEIEFEEINFSNLIENILKECELILKDKNINLNLKIQENVVILGNKILLEQLFNNIFNNAIKFTKNIISIKLYTKNNETILEIKDNGIGLSENDKILIWNRFYQVNPSRNKDINQGYGLGLSIVSRIIDLHKANFKLESKLNEGANFKIYFK